MRFDIVKFRNLYSIRDNHKFGLDKFCEWDSDLRYVLYSFHRKTYSDSFIFYGVDYCEVLYSAESNRELRLELVEEHIPEEMI